MALFNNLPQTSKEIGMLTADFSGLAKLDDIVRKTMERLIVSGHVQDNAAQVKNGNMSLQQFDGWFAKLARAELGKTLGIIRNKAVQKAMAGGAGSASGAVLRRMYKKEIEGAVHDLGNRKRISSKTRQVNIQYGGVSGIRRNRSVSGRTEMLRKYYGPDRSFILRFLDGGTDVRVARPNGPVGRGSKATYGSRGNIAPRNFFHSLSADMEAAANQLGMTLIQHVEKWTEQAFNE